MGTKIQSNQAAGNTFCFFFLQSNESNPLMCLYPFSIVSFFLWDSTALLLKYQENAKPGVHGHTQRQAWGKPFSRFSSPFPCAISPRTDFRLFKGTCPPCRALGFMRAVDHNAPGTAFLHGAGFLVQTREDYQSTGLVSILHPDINPYPQKHSLILGMGESEPGCSNHHSLSQATPNTTSLID